MLATYKVASLPASWSPLPLRPSLASPRPPPTPASARAATATARSTSMPLTTCSCATRPSRCGGGTRHAWLAAPGVVCCQVTGGMELAGDLVGGLGHQPEPQRAASPCAAPAGASLLGPITPCFSPPCRRTRCCTGGTGSRSRWCRSRRPAQVGALLMPRRRCPVASPSAWLPTLADCCLHPQPALPCTLAPAVHPTHNLTCLPAMRRGVVPRRARGANAPWQRGLGGPAVS